MNVFGRRSFVAIALAQLALVAGIKRTLAAKVGLTFGSKPYDIDLPDDEPLVVYIETQDVTPVGQYANVRVFLNTADRGWTQLTRCDDRMIPCEPSAMQIEQEIAPQGKQLYLDLPEAP